MSSTVRVRRAVLEASRLSNERLVNAAGGSLDTSIAQVTVDEMETRSWRVTLGRPERADTRPANIASLYRGSLFGYTAGIVPVPANPPRRANPVAGNGTDVDPMFCQIAWGQGNAQVNRLLAHWPMLGGSVIVHGSHVEVFGGTFLLGTPADEMPILKAQIAPDDGALDACELSLQQTSGLTVGATDEGVVYVPDFARRVKVIAGELSSGKPFDFGQPRLTLEWFDDRGILCDADQQGSTIGIPPCWHLVPARAVLLRVSSPGANLDCGETTFTDAALNIHWRIAP